MNTSITAGHPSQVIVDSWSEAKEEEIEEESGGHADPLASTNPHPDASDTACKANIPRPQKTRKPLKSYKCSHCSFAACSRSMMAVHMRIHTGEKPFQCDVCGRKFTRRFDLKRHKWLHTRDHPFRCPFCPMKSAHRNRLGLHIKKHHSQQ